MSYFSTISRMALGCAVVTSLLGVSVSRADTVNFDTAQGYTNGTLNGQPGTTPLWNYSANNPGTDYFQVNASAGTVTRPGSGDSVTANYLVPVAYDDGSVLQQTLDFTIAAGGTSSYDNGALIGLGITSNTYQYSYGAGFNGYLGHAQISPDAYYLTFNIDSGTASGTTYLAVPDSFLGLTSSVGTTDPLSLSYTQSLSADGTTTSLQLTLTNLTTDASLSLDPTVTGVTEFGSDVFGRIVSNNSGSNNAVPTFTQYTSPEAPETSPVPEPSTYATLGLGFAGLVMFQRSRKSRV